MKKSRVTGSQVMSVSKKLGAGVEVVERSRDHNVSNATLYEWRAEYGCMDTSTIMRIKELEVENPPLMEMYAEDLIKGEIRKVALEGEL